MSVPKIDPARLQKIVNDKGAGCKDIDDLAFAVANTSWAQMEDIDSGTVKLLLKKHGTVLPFGSKPAETPVAPPPPPVVAPPAPPAPKAKHKKETPAETPVAPPPPVVAPPAPVAAKPPEPKAPPAPPAPVAAKPKAPETKAPPAPPAPVAAQPKAPETKPPEPVAAPPVAAKPPTLDQAAHLDEIRKKYPPCKCGHSMIMHGRVVDNSFVYDPTSGCCDHYTAGKPKTCACVKYEAA
jgi:hypothetical protein